jgi:hypothetical protein
MLHSQMIHKQRDSSDFWKDLSTIDSIDLSSDMPALAQKRGPMMLAKYRANSHHERHVIFPATVKSLPELRQTQEDA